MKKALIVDDTEPNRLLLGAIIARLGIAVEHADDGDVALEKFRNAPADIVFIDQIMPNLRGSEAIKVIRGLKPETTTILMSSLSSATEISSLMSDCGADEFLPKPITSDAVRGLLRKYGILEGPDPT